jgi:hypothetical protein
MERCPSGLRSTLGKRVLRETAPGVQIPLSPPLACYNSSNLLKRTMKKNIIIVFLVIVIIGGSTFAYSYFNSRENKVELTESSTEEVVKEKPPETTYKAGDTFITYIETENVGDIAVQITLPKKPRYKEGAPLIMNVQTFFTDPKGFDRGLAPLTDEGFINVGYLWPGKKMPEGTASDGEFDYGGEDSIRALKDVIAFMSGSKTNNEGFMLDELIGITPLYEHSGIFAFSHPGIAMVNAMALYASELPNVSYLIARENPTDDIFSSVELGYWENDLRVENPLYNYEDNYDPTQIEIDYSSAKYDFDLDRAYFDLNNNNTPDENDHILGTRIPTMYDKRFYSIEMTKALAVNGLKEQGWPNDLATVEETEELWPFRTCIDNYPLLNESLHVMLVFSSSQHVQAGQDAPSVHQALDGYGNAGIWFRINPDEAYIHEHEAGNKPVKYEEHDANTEPSNWAYGGEWGYDSFKNAANVIALASITEMADRSYTNNWSKDLDTIIEY